MYNLRHVQHPIFNIKCLDQHIQSTYVHIHQARLWQRGLSLYYAERFDDGTQQFRALGSKGWIRMGVSQNAKMDGLCYIW